MGEGGHWAVIMARGQSRRLGFPKGAARLGPEGKSLLARVDELYRGLGFNRLVVTLPELVGAYQELLPPDSCRGWLAHAGGGDTAQTLFAAWGQLKSQPTPIQWVWAHPVDLPLVRPSTVELLARLASGCPDRVLQPLHQGVPGHPVVLPWPILDQLCRQAGPGGWPGPMRTILQQAAGRLGRSLIDEVPVPDEGVIRDFDDPQAFQEE